MWRTAVRNLLGHKFRLLTTALAVMLGVAFMAGTLVLADTMKKTFDDLFADVYENTDVVVRAEAAFEDPSGFGDQRGRIDASMLGLVQRVDGVKVAEPEIWGFAQLVDKQGEPIGSPGTGPPIVGGNYLESDELSTWTLVSGTAPRSDDEVVIDKANADEAGYVVGDMATVLVQGPPRTVRIAGIVTFGGADSPGGAHFVMFTRRAAEQLIGQPGKINDVVVVADDGVSQSELVRRIQKVLPPGTEAITGAAITEETQDAIQKGLSVFNRFMLVFAVISLFVGGYIIFNTFFITVAQRTKENALMRAVGASKRQVLWSVLIEAFGVGLVASVVGLGAGVLVASALKALLVAAGFDLPATGVVFTPTTAVISLVAGMTVTMVAAISPARKAGKVPPVAAMRDVAVGSTGYGSKERIFVGSGLLVLGVGSLLYGLFGSPSNGLAVVGLGVLVVFFAVSVLGRTVALPLSRVIGAPLPRLRGIAGHLAHENAMRNPKRTAATASALMIGVGLVTFITIFASSTKASIDKSIEKAFTGDLVLTKNADLFGGGGIDPSLAERLNRLPEVEVASAIRGGMAEIAGSVAQFVAVDPTTAFDIVDVDPITGSTRNLDADGIAVHVDKAEEHNLTIGDRVPVVFRDSGRKDMTVELIYGEHDLAGHWFMGIDAYKANFAEQFDFQIFVKKAEGVPAQTALAAVKQASAAFPGTKVLDQTGYKEEMSGFVDQMLGLVYALLALAIVIALLGIGNTLALSILERTRELGVLRAVGMTRRQLRAAVRWESVIIALQGTLLGLVIGIFFGWALVRAMEDEGITTFDLPMVSLTVVVVLAALAGVLAAVLPARRAAKLNVLAAVVSE